MGEFEGGGDMRLGETKDNPILLDSIDYHLLRAMIEDLEKQLNSLPIQEQDAFAKKATLYVLARYPILFPNAFVKEV